MNIGERCKMYGFGHLFSTVIVEDHEGHRIFKGRFSKLTDEQKAVKPIAFRFPNTQCIEFVVLDFPKGGLVNEHR